MRRCSCCFLQRRCASFSTARTPQVCRRPDAACLCLGSPSPQANGSGASKDQPAPTAWRRLASCPACMNTSAWARTECSMGLLYPPPIITTTGNPRWKHHSKTISFRLCKAVLDSPSLPSLSLRSGSTPAWNRTKSTSGGGANGSPPAERRASGSTVDPRGVESQASPPSGLVQSGCCPGCAGDDGSGSAGWSSRASDCSSDPRLQPRSRSFRSSARVAATAFPRSSSADSPFCTAAR
mmetsp:Transcript_21557/g.82041  ORF Transcript_21557/g.82041 Transcript_21557/m.82041 type:complete len:238 (+) Transcript_21557:516-1229(+)